MCVVKLCMYVSARVSVRARERDAIFVSQLMLRIILTNIQLVVISLINNCL